MWQIPLLDLLEEKLDLGDIWELLPNRFLRMAVVCSGKDTCTDSADAAKLMDFRESEEALLPRLRESSSSDSSLSVPLSVMSSSSHKPWHWESIRDNSGGRSRWGSWFLPYRIPSHMIRKPNVKDGDYSRWHSYYMTDILRELELKCSHQKKKKVGKEHRYVWEVMGSN